MSHASYCYLLTLDDPDILVCGGGTEIVHEIICAFESAMGHRLGDDNFYMGEAAITQSGQIISLAEPGDYRRRDEFASDLLESGVEDPWKWGLNFALRCVASELGIAQKVLDELREGRDIAGNADVIHSQAKARLLARLMDLKDTFRPDVGYDRDVYELCKLLTGFSLFLESVVPGFVTRPVSPYDYRACDCRQDHSLDFAPGDLLAIVDIHT